MKSENLGQYEMFLEGMCSKITSVQDSFESLKSSMANLIQNLPDEEKEAFILKYSRISESFESMFNRYNKSMK